MNNRRKLNSLLCIIGLAIAPCLTGHANAQVSSGGNYSVTQKVIAGGGASSAAGPFELLGTIGQHGVGTSTAGLFTVEGGFWPGDGLIAPPPPPCAVDVTSQMSIMPGEIDFDPVTQHYTQPITVYYHGTVNLRSETEVALDDLTPGVSVVNTTGKTNCAAPTGSPRITIGGTLDVGATAFTVIEYSFSGTLPNITFKPRVLTGDYF